MTRPDREWEKAFANHLSDKVIVARIYFIYIFPKLNRKKINE